MKKLFLPVLVVLLISSAVLAQNGNRRGNRGGNVGTNIGLLPIEEISDVELESLLLMREEEKLAYDVYTALYEKWEYAIFTNIAASELRHTSSVKLLLEKYEIADPYIDEPGVYSNEELTALYNSLVSQGSESVVDALIVGMTIEDLDIYDLIEALEVIDNQDIQMVYENLLKGSRNHLRGFYAVLLAEGGSYEPQFISQELFDSIIDSEREGGNKNGGGKGGRQCGREIPPEAFESNTIQSKSFPNPANPTMTINYTLTTPAQTKISIYNSLGQLVKTQEMGYQSKGSFSFHWDATDLTGQAVTSGMYFYRIQAGNFTTTNRFLIIQ